MERYSKGLAALGMVASVRMLGSRLNHDSFVLKVSNMDAMQILKEMSASQSLFLQRNKSAYLEGFEDEHMVKIGYSVTW